MSSTNKLPDFPLHRFNFPLRPEVDYELDNDNQVVPSSRLGASFWAPYFDDQSEDPISRLHLLLGRKYGFERALCLVTPANHGVPWATVKPGSRNRKHDGRIIGKHYTISAAYSMSVEEYASQIRGICSATWELLASAGPHDTAFWDFEKVPVLGDIYARHASWALLNLANRILSIDPNIATLAYFYYLEIAQGNFVFDELDFQDDPKLVRILSLAMEIYNVLQDDKMYTDYIADVLLEEWPKYRQGMFGRLFPQQVRYF